MLTVALTRPPPLPPSVSRAFFSISLSLPSLVSSLSVSDLVSLASPPFPFSVWPRFKTALWPKGREVLPALCRGLGTRDWAAWHLKARTGCFQKARQGFLHNPGLVTLSTYQSCRCHTCHGRTVFPHNTSADTKCAVSCPALLLQLPGASWWTSLWVQCGHYLPGVSITPYKLRAQSCNTTHIPHASCKSLLWFHNLIK